jgi:hypothetical protein
MGLQEEIRTDLATEVFDAFGKTVSFINKSTPIYNTWGEIEGWTETTSQIVVVPYDILWDRKSPQKFGELKEGEMSMAVKYDQTVAKGDVFILDSDRFTVVEVNKNYLPDNVVTILRLAREEYLVSDDLVPSSS